MPPTTHGGFCRIYRRRIRLRFISIGRTRAGSATVLTTPSSPASDVGSQERRSCSGAPARLMRPDQSTPADGSDLAFAALILARLRNGGRPGPRALEQAPLIEQWTITPCDQIFELAGIAWRLPLSRSVFAGPLLAIDPAAGWARTLDEWVVISDPQSACCVDSIAPEEVTRRAAVWLRLQLNARAADRAKRKFAPRVPAVAAI
jgi:hypothetical protein